MLSLVAAEVAKRLLVQEGTDIDSLILDILSLHLWNHVVSTVRYRLLCLLKRVVVAI